MNAIVLTVGDEILIGQVIDTNSAWIGSTFNELGINLLEILSVGDELDAIKNGIDYGLKKADIVIMTGGLGPTKDDITKIAIAQYFDVGMTFSQSTYDRIVKLFEKYGKQMQESHKDQCFMPNNVTLLHNRMGTAPGMLIKSGDKILVSLPGVPFEMKAIITDELIPILKSKPSEISIFHKTIMTAGEGESFIADRIFPFIEDMPDYIKIAYLPSLGSVRLRLTGKHKDLKLLQKEIGLYCDNIVNELGHLVYGFDDISLQECIMNLFNQKNMTLSAAESCTGGYISHMITSISGSSSYYLGGLITYSNEIKMSLLKVKEETLSKYGAVSEECVREMALGLLKVTKSNIGISVSGIAGPGGGSIEKPVGTIWMAVSDGNRTEAYKINATKDRLKNIEYASTVLLNKLRLFMTEK